MDLIYRKRHIESGTDPESSSSAKKRLVDHETCQKRKLTTDDYTVGWICPLEVEQIAALEMLDEEHERLPQAPTDHNVYNLGSIAGHNVVVAGLHQAGNCPAATVVTQMRMTFQNLRFGLLVGIGGGVPVKTDHGMIRLGDVVVSKPAGGHSGAVQYDHGKARAGNFERTGALAPPPAVLLNAAQDLAARRARSRTDPVQDNIKRIDISIRGLRKYKNPGIAKDHLYEPDYIHLKPELTCDQCGCDPSKRVQRLTTDDEDDDGNYDDGPCIVVHRGIIASGELVVKDAKLRDELAEEYGILCFEMEAAGALADFPCLVIRGISDYCDSHKNNRWHGYAAATAAAYSRQLFFHMPIDEVKRYISETTEKTIRSMNIRQEDQDRQKLLEWLSPTSFPAQQHDIISRRQDGTGQWFLDSREFQEWLQGSNKTLFCPGIPGVGKTMMAAVAVDFLYRTLPSDETGIACVFCSYKAQVDQSAANLFAAILKQLLQARPSIAEPVRRLHKQHVKQGTRPSLDDVFSALRDALARSSATYIVIDALDECREDSRQQFVAKLQDLQTVQDVRLIATSRAIPEIVGMFKGALSLEVQASREDIKRFVAGQIPQLPRCIQRDSVLQDLVQNKIIEAVDGMFLLARLHTDSLLDKRTVKDVKNTLDQLSKGSTALSNAYRDCLQRIEGQLGDDQKLAKKVLGWVTLAKRPLNTAELCCALAVEPNTEELDPENVPDIEDLVSVCAGLVVVDQESAIVRLVHYTTQEYFEQIKDIWNPDAPLHLATTCLNYLCFSTFRRGSCSTDEEFEERLQQNKFLDYAAKHWGDHAAIVEEEVCELASRFLSHSECAAQVMLIPNSNHANYSQDFPKDTTGLHLTARFGLCIIAQGVLPGGKDEITVTITMQDTDGQTPLSLAARFGRRRFVQLLIAMGADVNAGSSNNGKALQVASKGGHEAIVRLLLDEGADVNAHGGFYGNALQAASEGGHEAVVRLLLDEGADVNGEGEIYGSALQAASEKGHDAIIRLLLDEGADVNAQGGTCGNALQAASEGGHEAIVRLLLDEGADVNAQGGFYGNALQAALARGHEAIAKLLLDEGADVNAHGGYYGRALQAASRGGHEALVRLLLDEGADVNAQGGEYDNALQAASKGGNEAIVRLLLDEGADVNLQGGDYGNALQAASRGGHKALVRLLLDEGADVNAQGGDCGDALQAASEEGHEALVRLLLDEGANVNAHGGYYGNALQAASIEGHQQVVKLLLNAGAIRA